MQFHNFSKNGVHIQISLFKINRMLPNMCYQKYIIFQENIIVHHMYLVCYILIIYVLNLDMYIFVVSVNNFFFLFPMSVITDISVLYKCWFQCSIPRNCVTKWMNWRQNWRTPSSRWHLIVVEGAVGRARSRAYPTDPVPTSPTTTNPSSSPNARPHLVLHIVTFD